jgi:hypothetical protein
VSFDVYSFPLDGGGVLDVPTCAGYIEVRTFWVWEVLMVEDVQGRYVVATYRYASFLHLVQDADLLY